MLFRLVYFSRNLLRRSDASPTNPLLTILRAAERNNLALGLTGALLFDKDHFAQVLEGDRPNVTRLFVRICQDPRHDDLNIVDARPVSERRFPDWSMAMLERPAGTPFGPECLWGDDLVGLMLEQLAQADASLKVPVPVW